MKVEIYNASASTWVDITPWIAWQGLTFSRNDVDAPNTGRDISGLMHRGRVASKEKMQVNTIPLTNKQSATLQSLIYPESYRVRVTPYPRTNATQIFLVYSNNVNVKFLFNKKDLQTLSFPMIEM